MKKIGKIILCVGILMFGWLFQNNNFLLLNQKFGEQPEYVIIEGCMKYNFLQEKILKHYFKIEDFEEGTSFIPREKMKILHQGDRLTIQVITDCVEEGFRWYHFWQNFANIWGNNEQIGITFVSKAYKDIDEKYLLEIAKEIAGTNCSNQLEEDIIFSAVGYEEGLGTGIEVVGERLNWNVVCNKKSGRIYLGSPIIYQTY